MENRTKYPDTTTTSKEVFAKNLKHLIKQNRMNYREFADKIGMKYTTVLDWVNGRTYPRIDKLDEIATFFNLDKGDLIEELKFFRLVSIDLKKFIESSIQTLESVKDTKYDEYPLEPHNKKFLINTLKQIDLVLQDEVRQSKKRKALETFNTSFMKSQDEEIEL